MNCDLHTHSVYSDGTFQPGRIIAEAKRIGLGAVALTDHNTVSGLPEFMEQARQQGVTAVGGVELSTDWEGIEFHLLGLFVEPEHYQTIENLAKEFHVQKEISNIDTIERLNEAGYLISYAKVRKKHPNGNVNRAHIAAELMEKGYVESINEAFATVLRDDAGFYVPPARLQLMDAIRFLQQVHAVSVLAHPLKDADLQQLNRLLPQAVDAGLMGIETRHCSYTREQEMQADALAESFGLLKSGGSDFHGENKPDVRLGVGQGNLSVGMDVYHALKKAHEK